MKAAVLKNWLDLELCDIPVPVPGENEALIKVKRAGVCGSDITVYRGKHMTATVPTVLCHEILGTIESLPEGYDGKFKLGQRVLMNPIISCGKCAACQRGLPWVCENLKLLGIHVDGGFAEYTKVGVDKLVALDEDIPDEVAILGEPFAVGQHVMVNSQVQKGDKVKENDVLIIIEAMKMETSVVARMQGEVDDIKVAVGDTVVAGQLMMTLKTSE